MHQRLSQLICHLQNCHCESSRSADPGFSPTCAPTPQPTTMTFAESPLRIVEKRRPRFQSDMCTNASANYYDICRIATANRREAPTQVSVRHVQQRLSQLL